MVLDEADRAAAYGVRVVCYAIGPEALDRPLACVEMAARSGGRFLAVRDPEALSEIVPEVNFAEIDGLEVRNRTNGRAALGVRVNPDGTWDALVPVAEGENAIEVEAWAEDGSRARAELVVRGKAGAAAPPPAALVPRRGRLVDRVADDMARRRRLEILAELRREIEAARERAARQRRELDLELQEAPAPGD